MSEYKRGSLTLSDTVALGTGVMIGAGIFAGEKWFLKRSEEE